MKLNFITKMMLGVSAAVAVASCALDDEPQYVTNPNVAYGVIVNASPGSGDLFFFADQNQVNANAINYGTALGYYNFYTGNRVLTVRNSAGNVLATDTIALHIDDFFTAFAVNRYDDIELVTYRDSLEYPAAGRALVRFINLAPDAAPVTVSTPTDTLTTGLQFKGATEFMDIAAGSYNFTYTNTATADSIYTSGAQELSPNHIYTIYTKGFVTPAAGSNDTFSVEKMRNY